MHTPAPIREVAAALALALCTTTPAGAEMVLSDVTVELASDQEPEDLEIWNSGDEPLFIDVELNEILEPQSATPQRQRVESLREAGLLVTPSRMVLQPNERRMLRIAVRAPATERDRVYRVALVPRANPVHSGEQLALQVLVGYDVLVIVRPENPSPRLQVERDGREVQIANLGNSSVLIRKLTQCSGGAEACVDLPGNRMYAGEAWTVRLPADSPVHLHRASPDGEVVEAF